MRESKAIRRALSICAVAVAAASLWACEKQPPSGAAEAEARRQAELAGRSTPAFRNLGKRAEGAPGSS